MMPKLLVIVLLGTALVHADRGGGAFVGGLAAGTFLGLAASGPRTTEVYVTRESNDDLDDLYDELDELRRENRRLRRQVRRERD